ncbi:hypothetical protein [Paenibacillus polymyxa]|uniref:Glyoxalase n=1 Tax=Paenibacillus polymyxa (strain SC2) TaxID=886882 RepID=E3EH10_PAEPS|nr:hypothetical protein [Paenibacillus polymyxa]ADO55570.1 hypothetical protein PPSC2_07615 [Paenibacillus polymyxa SC2]WPQ58341.1 hypothetical protein SKN87_07775 [Paenibacillus polymyxa]CCC84385.1 hypothetical protein PPM_1448 [Paenibacillus polymyxa M1]
MKLKAVLLDTRSFEAMKAFYGSLLDLQVVEEGPSRLSFQVGESVLVFQESSHMENEFYHKKFAPLGDVEGSFIVTDKQRPWFPDDRLPAVFGISVLFEGTCSARLSLHKGLYELRSI